MAFNCINSAVIINKPFYHYWKGNTTSLTSVYKEDLSLKWDRLHNRISKILDNNNKELIFYEALNNRICMSTLGLILNECSNKDVSVLKRIEGVKAVLNNKNIIGSFSDFNLEYLPMYWKFFYYFNKKRNYILSYFMGSVINSLRKLV